MRLAMPLEKTRFGGPQLAGSWLLPVMPASRGDVAAIGEERRHFCETAELKADVHHASRAEVAAKCHAA